MFRNVIRMLYLGTGLWYFIASAVVSLTCTFCNFIQLLSQQGLKRIDVGQAGVYIACAGDYVGCAGDYGSCSGDYGGCAGVYRGRAGDYVRCAGDN